MQENLNELAESVKSLVAALSKPRPVVPIDKQIWDADSCAEYLVVSRRQFTEHIACKPDFPACIDISTGGRRNPRWRASEVIRWVDSRQEKKRA
ncbi:helix-turn-helix transcriptional regulator [Aquitalea aquatilis]|uniref:helix-turn-helix transcriptional regulator n=1 Tax=Aquitalea aquatilis TaxID=1537400 RepID=UPI0010BE04B1|nr:hypothetical protein [Aquitalea aquatilis]